MLIRLTSKLLAAAAYAPPSEDGSGMTTEGALTTLANALVSGTPVPDTEPPAPEATPSKPVKGKAARAKKIPYCGKEPRKAKGAPAPVDPTDPGDMPAFLTDSKIKRGNAAGPMPPAIVEAAKKERERTMTSTTKSTTAKGKAKKRVKSQADVIAALLTREKGCTAADIKKATGWKAVNVPRQAKASGLKLKQKRDDGVTRYWGAAK